MPGAFCKVFKRAIGLAVFGGIINALAANFKIHRAGFVTVYGGKLVSSSRFIVSCRVGFCCFNSNKNRSVCSIVACNLHQVIPCIHTRVKRVTKGFNGAKFCTYLRIAGQTSVGFIHCKTNITRLYGATRLAKVYPYTAVGRQTKFIPNAFFVNATNCNGRSKGFAGLQRTQSKIILCTCKNTKTKSSSRKCYGTCIVAIIICRLGKGYFTTKTNNAK